jgi:ribonuclease P protein component
MPLSKNNRIVTDREIKAAYMGRFKSRSNLFQTYLSSTNSDKFQLLVVISKKVFKRANMRNRLRRRTTGIFADLQHTNQLPKNIAVIINIKHQNMMKLSPIEMKNLLVEELMKLYVLSLQKHLDLDKKPRVARKYNRSESEIEHKNTFEATKQTMMIHS